MTSRIVVALAALLACLAACPPARAAESGGVEKLPFEAPGVLLSFEGGNVAGNLVSVLKTLQKYGITVPVKQRKLDDNTTVCGLLLAENFPPPCGSLLPAMQMLNPKADLGRLHAGDVFNVPDIPIYDYTASGQFLPNDPKQAVRGQGIVKNWGHLSPNVEERPDGSRSITYRAFQVFVPTKDDTAVAKLYEQLSPLGSSNLLVDRLLKEPRPAQVFSSRPLASAELMSQACRDGKWNAVSYSDYLTGDPDAIDVVKASLPQTQATVPVWLIDGPLMPAPNLYPAFGASPNPADWTWTCKWTPFSTALHHANHMASIIASQSEKIGFIGLARNVVIKQTPWLGVGADGTATKLSLREVYLQRTIVRTENGPGRPLRVYLMASSYDDSTTTPLATPDLRFSRGLLSKTIKDNHPLLIAAAGQAFNPDDDGIDLTTKTPMSPMNLGDLEGVIIVTACDNCGRASAKLMHGANFSAGDHKLVHIAAPGGQDIGGWVSADSIGAARGTSQAAAFAAGVAASMISNYPDVFTQSRLVKRRLQVTSWPLPIGDGTSQDPNRLAAGVVDPVLALLDPSKTWIKAGGWRSGSVKGLSIDPIPFTNAGQNDEYVKAEAILRLMKTNKDTNQFSVYTDRNLVGKGEVAEIGRLDGVTAPSRAVLVMCDGTEIKLSEVDDFIPAMQGFDDGSCR